MIGVAAETALKYAVVVKHGNWQSGSWWIRFPNSHLVEGSIFTGSGRHGRRVNPFVSTVVKLEDRLRGVLETSAVLSHFEGTG